MNLPNSKEELLIRELPLNRVIVLAIDRQSTKKSPGLKGYSFGGEGEVDWIATPPHLEQMSGEEKREIQNDEQKNLKLFKFCLNVSLPNVFSSELRPNLFNFL